MHVFQPKDKLILFYECRFLRRAYSYKIGKQKIIIANICQNYESVDIFQ